MAIIACKLQEFSALEHLLKLKACWTSNIILKQILQQWNDIKNPSCPMGKHRSWSNMLLNNKNIDSLSHRRTKFKYYAKMLMHIGNNMSCFLHGGQNDLILSAIQEKWPPKLRQDGNSCWILQNRATELRRASWKTLSTYSFICRIYILIPKFTKTIFDPIIWSYYFVFLVGTRCH